MKPLVLNWPLSSMTGYGIYGMQILRQYLKRGGKDFVLSDRPILPIDLPKDVDARLRPQMEKAAQAAMALERNPNEILRFDGPVLQGVGNCYATFRNQLRVKGRPNIGCAAIEEPICPPDWAPFMRIYDMFIAISRWNAEFLKNLEMAPVHLCHQGIDTALFHPHGKPKNSDGRFRVFSGGKFEFRKGQDIVVEAFKRFREKHPDALLVTSWQNGQTADTAPFLLAGHCMTVPAASEGSAGLNIDAWLLAQGLPQENFIDLGWRHNSAMPDILRDCDAAIFPNRCEGGTNLVAMETIACGVPTYAAANTGHKDLVDLIGCGAFRQQKPVRGVPEIRSVEGWGESDVDEIVAALEHVYDHPAEARAEAMKSADRIREWDWAAQNENLLQRVYETA